MTLSTWSGGVVVEYEGNTTREIYNRRVERLTFRKKVLVRCTLCHVAAAAARKTSERQVARRGSIALRPSSSMSHFAVLGGAYNCFNFVNIITIDVKHSLIFLNICKFPGLVSFCLHNACC